LKVRGADADDDLVMRAGQGDQQAVRTLVSRKAPRLYALAGRMLGDLAEAEDVVQEAFFRTWRFAPKWRPGAARFDTWLHRVTLNLCYDRLRRRISTVELPSDQLDLGPPPDRALHAQDIGRRVDAALRGLSPRQREAIILCHYQELSNIEAADVMEVSVDALESLLARGRRALRLTLSDLAVDE
jgi:RNA polymerase sigma factor (sigma-70 family)